MRIALLAAVAMVVSLACATNVFAHAEPATARPGDGAVLTSAPAEVVLVMSQELARQAGGNDVDVFDATGREVTTVAAVVDNNDRTRLSVALPSGLLPGRYTVKWKSLSSEDGDSAEGELSFTFDPNGMASAGKEKLREDLLNPGGTASPTGSAGTMSVDSDDDGVTWVLVIAAGLGMFILGAGGTFLLVQKRQ